MEALLRVFVRPTKGRRHLHDFEVSPACLTSLGIGIYGHVRLKAASKSSSSSPQQLPGHLIPNPDLCEDKIIVCDIEVLEALNCKLGQLVKIDFYGEIATADNSQIFVEPLGEKSSLSSSYDEMEIVNRAVRGLALEPKSLLLVSYLGQTRRYRVVAVSSDDGGGEEDRAAAVCERDTIFCLTSSSSSSKLAMQDVEEGYVDGDDSDVLQELLEWVSEISFSTEHAVRSPHHHLLQVRGILLTGPAGAGKTRLLHTILSRVKKGLAGSSIPASYIKAADLVNGLGRDDDSSDRITLAALLRPAGGGVLLIDDFDMMIPDNMDEIVDASSSSSSSNALMALRQSLLGHQEIQEEEGEEGLRPLCWILAGREALGSGSTGGSGLKGRARALAALQTSSLYDRVIEIPVPTPQQRTRILTSLLSSPKNWCLLAGSDAKHSIDQLSQLTGGFLPGDLVALFENAAARALLRRSTEEQQQHKQQGEEGEGASYIKWQDLMAARTEISPAILTGLDVSKPQGLSWQDIGGYNDIKTRLQQLILWPTQHRGTFIRLGLGAPPGILLHGPSGCGKSFLARVLACECHANFVKLPASEVFSPYLGDSEARLRSAFARARRASPCILFLDELDAMAAQRESSEEGQGGSVYGRVLSTLLNEMDGVSGRTDGLLVLAATNRLEAVDAALLRPGRLQEALLVPWPDPSMDYIPILQASCKQIPLAEDVDFKEIVDLMLVPHVIEQGKQKSCITPASLASLCREAALESLRQDIESAKVTQQHFTKALEKMFVRK